MAGHSPDDNKSGDKYGGLRYCSARQNYWVTMIDIIHSFNFSFYYYIFGADLGFWDISWNLTELDTISER